MTSRRFSSVLNLTILPGLWEFTLFPVDQLDAEVVLKVNKSVYIASQHTNFTDSMQ